MYHQTSLKRIASTYVGCMGLLFFLKLYGLTIRMGGNIYLHKTKAGPSSGHLLAHVNENFLAIGYRSDAVQQLGRLGMSTSFQQATILVQAYFFQNVSSGLPNPLSQLADSLAQCNHHELCRASQSIHSHAAPLLLDPPPCAADTASRHRSGLPSCPKSSVLLCAATTT